MKILLLLTEVFSKEGGIQTYNRCLLKALSELSDKHSLEITVFSLNDRASENNITNHQISFYPFYKNKIKYSMQSIFESRKYDLIIIGHTNLLPLVNLFSTKVKKYLIVHGIEVWRSLKFLQRIALSKIHKILSVSNYTKKEFQRYSKVEDDRFYILPNTIIESDKLKQAENLTVPFGKMILTVSRLDSREKYKNIDLVVKAMPEILKSVKDAFYVIAGDGDDRKRLEELAKKLNIAEKVLFPGRISVEELNYYYKNCNLFVLPSTGEGFGIVFLEAMYFAKPCIGANAGGVPEVIKNGETGFLVEPNDLSSLSENIIKLLKDNNLCYLMGRAGKKRFESEFSFEEFKERVNNIL